jgi:hypothetical protein
MIMDGFRLFDTYKRYKTGQSKFTTWLKQTAEKCIYDSKSTREDRKPTTPRGKPTQNGPSGTIVRMAEFAGLAKTIVAQVDSIPGSIIQTLRDVIVQRKKAFKHYQKGSGYDPSSSDGHLHIIEVLEDVMKIFEGARSKENAGEKYDISQFRYFLLPAIRDTLERFDNAFQLNLLMRVLTGIDRLLMVTA